MSSEEQILVVPTSLFHELGCFQGFSDRVDHYLPVLLNERNTEYRPRSTMEQDPSFKQLIPYVVFRVLAADGQYHYFHYTRGSGQGEQRLHAKKSVGVGGHISLEDTQHPDAYLAGMQRELTEEVHIGAVAEDRDGDSGSATASPYLGRIIGLINDDSNEVGRVHLGVVHLVDLAEPVVTAREKDLVDARFSSPQDLELMLEQFETWSQIALKYLLVNVSVAG
ncbi:MAG: phosphoesterase [Planctomycetaceae bacterium]|nr:phosphoesterase [Planctomycetaceae bacterium]